MKKRRTDRKRERTRKERDRQGTDRQTERKREISTAKERAKGSLCPSQRQQAALACEVMIAAKVNSIDNEGLNNG